MRRALQARARTEACRGHAPWCDLNRKFPRGLPFRRISSRHGIWPAAGAVAAPGTWSERIIMRYSHELTNAAVGHAAPAAEGGMPLVVVGAEVVVSHAGVG